MSGYTARTGFRYQDLYLLFRVLRDASDSLDQAWLIGASDIVQVLGKQKMRYGIEASPRVATPTEGTITAGPDWDVLVLADNKLEFAEVKSGAVSKDDRVAFWCRLRRELAEGYKGRAEVVPVLVVDPGTAGDLTKWQGLAIAASKFFGSPPSVEPANNVFTAPQLLDEALWWMCRPDSSDTGSNPAVAVTVARNAFSRFELHCHEAQQLDLGVSQLLELLFPGGLAETDQTLLLGWLSKRATTSTPERRLFTIRDLLAEIGILEHAISLTPGTLKAWRDLWNEVPQGVHARTRLQLGNAGESVPAAKVQPAALEALTNGKCHSVVILGQGGSGKSALVAQAARGAVQRGDVVLHCGADDVSAEELEQLIKAFRFRAAVIAIKKPDVRASIFVDGLDEAEASLRKRWGQLLLRLSALPNVFVFTSVREAVWRGDGELRKELESWPSVTLALWPENLVRDLLAPTPYIGILSQSVIELLRTPILLDLFWQTFVESGTRDVSLATSLQTRQNLLSAYWEKRLVDSPRYASVRELCSRLGGLFSQAVRYIGAFSGTNLDAEIVQVLLSEGVLVREDRLQPRLRFRHPLLRDFAFAQWCLAAESAVEVARRWNSIKGGLQRYGALRAVFEALLDANARNEYPRLELGNVVQAIVRADASLAGQVAQVLGTHPLSHGLDPGTWPLEVQAYLPSSFGRDLVAAAKLEGNGLWAAHVEEWPDDSNWLNREYPKEVWLYASALFERLKATSPDQRLREQCRQAARALRRISEVERFTAEFGEYERWLMMQAILLVIPVLPDEATLAWVEREVTKSSWRTRSSVLERLIYLAPVNARRAAVIYRKAVGLSESKGRNVLAAPLRGGVIDHQAIEWSLAGEDGRRGLLKEHPEAFLPVALELAEALWHDRQEDRNSGANRISELIREFDPSWSKEVEAEHKRQKQERLGDLIDDGPEWSYWRTLPKHDAHERILRAIHECAEQCAKNSPQNFTSSVAPILRRSRLASVHSILLDVLLKQKVKPSFVNCILDLMLDSRLYHVSGIGHWLEQGLITCWPTARPGERAKILAIIKGLLATPGEEHKAKNFLLRVPAEDLPDDLRKQRPPEDDPSHLPYERPHNIDIGFGGVPIKEDDERHIGSWPENFDREALKLFAHSTRELSRQNSPVEQLREKVPSAVQAALSLMPILLSHVDLLRDPNRWWVWRSLADTLDCFQKLHEGKEAPPEELIRDCAQLALTVLKVVPAEIPGELPKDEVWTGYRETEWVCALRLADAVLTLPPVADDQTIQSEFERILEAAFATGQPLIQLVCTITVRPWHWFRSVERRNLHDRLIWNVPAHASVLTWSLSRISNYSDSDRTRVFRLLMNRTGVEDSRQLAHQLGHYVGISSMVVFQTGQRSAGAELAREAIETPKAFALLRDSTNCREFLRQLIFGMKEQADLMWNRTELAAEYGNWALKVWRVLRSNRQRRGESENVVLVAMHWLEKKERRQRDKTKLGVWWQSLQPLVNAVATEGGRPDCFTLFFNLRDGEYNDLTTPEELIRLGEDFTERLQRGLRDGTMKLDELDQEHEEWNSWRESAEHLAETIDSLRRDGSLQTDVERERAHGLLSKLAAEPIRSPKAIEVLHRLQND